MDRRGSTNLRSAPEVVWGRESGLRKQGFDSGPIDKVHKLIDVATAVGVEVRVIGVLVNVETEDGGHAPNGVGVLGVADVVEEFLGAVIEPGPGPAAGGDAGGFQVFLVVVEGAEVLVNVLAMRPAGLPSPPRMEK